MPNLGGYLMIQSAKRFGLAFGATATLMMATPAASQLTIFEDYTPSDGVIEMTLVEVEEGMMDTYLEGLRGTWVAANDVAQRLGHIEGYGMYMVPYGPGDSFNLVLTIRMAATSDISVSQDRYNEFMAAWGQENMDRSNQTVRDLYNNIREIQGTYMLREIEMNTGE